ncbi:MAG: T9SS type A sorting domain-containing protein [Candidatus Kapabacteria bacterium]|nr:T9SS type A sorting domain-containing protein [Candidatus Kapabacteria bacterium]
MWSKHTLATALAVLLMTLMHSAASAQRDTTAPDMVFSGRLVTASTSEISLEAYDPNGTVAMMSFVVNAETAIHGCTIDKVQSGTFTMVVTTPDAAGRQIASTVKFDGCSPAWNFVARITTITSGSVRIELIAPSELGDAGQTLDLTITDATVIYSCDGTARTLADLAIGSIANINATGTAANGLTAVTIALQDDCPQSLYVEATFVLFDGKTLVVTDQATNETLRLTVSSEFGRVPGDSAAPFYTCDGMPLDPSSIREGDKLNIVYLLVPKRGSFLQYAQSTVGCPIYVAGRITARDGDMLTITASDAAYTARITNETSITTCDRGGITSDQITVGAAVQASILQVADGMTFQSIQVQDGCPYAFYASGTITSIDGSSMSLDGFTSEDGALNSVALTIDDATQSINCIGSAQPLATVVPGSSVVAYYRINGGQRTADMVLVQSPCDVATIYGTIQEVGDNFIVVSEDGISSLNMLYSPTTIVTNCNGDVVAFTSSMVGSSISATYATTSKPPMLVSASVNFGCPVIITQGGIITAIGDSSVTIQSAGTSVELNRTPYTSAYDAMLQPIAWSALKVGDEICGWYDEAGKLLYRIAVGVDCSLRNMGATGAVIGSIVRADDREIVVDGRAGTMSFALTAVTEMESSADRAVSISDLAPGAMVSVMSSTYNSKGQPVASSVTLMSVTSVNADPATAATALLFPNPASQTVTIANAVDGDVITIFDQQGTAVARTTSAVVAIDVLAPGLYTVTHRTASTTAAAPLIIVR